MSNESKHNNDDYSPEDKQVCTDPNCNCHNKYLPHVMEFFKENGKTVMEARQRGLRMAACYLADKVAKEKGAGRVPSHKDTDAIKAEVINYGRTEIEKTGNKIPEEVAEMFYEKFADDALTIYGRAQRAANRRAGCGDEKSMPDNFKDPLWALFNDKEHL